MEPTTNTPKRRGRTPKVARSKRVTIRSARELGALVRLARLRLDMTQTEAAICCGVGRRFYIELENGKTTLQLDKVLTVLDALGLNLALGGPAAAFTVEELSTACLKREPGEPEHVWEAEMSKSVEKPFKVVKETKPRRGRKNGQMEKKYAHEVNAVKVETVEVVKPKA